MFLLNQFIATVVKGHNSIYSKWRKAQKTIFILPWHQSQKNKTS